MEVSVSEAKNRLTELLKVVEGGDIVTITRHGTPCAEIVKSKSYVTRKRKFGVLGDKKIILNPEWNSPIEDIDAWMRGEL